jgi:hypothetical protein
MESKRLYAAYKKRIKNMKGYYQLLGGLIDDFFMCFASIIMIIFGFKSIYSKNEKIRNKKRGIFLVIAGFILFIYHLVNIIIYFVNMK